MGEMAPQEGVSDVVDRVKALCRADPANKMAWCNWCDVNAGGTKDPSRLEESQLRAFFEDFESGRIQAVEKQSGDGSQDELSAAVKLGQKLSPAWKAAWVRYCQVNGESTYDPARHTREFLLGYMEFLGKTALGGLGAVQPAAFGRGAHGAVQHGSVVLRHGPAVYGVHVAPRRAAPLLEVPPAKRRRVAGNFEPAASGGAEVEAMVAKVKALQKTDPSRKQQWSDFCDQQGSGVKDPSRHDAQSLQAFFSQIGESPY